MMTSKGVLRLDQPDRHILQVICGDLNTYLLYRDGRVFASGSNSYWQCTRIESMENDKDECVDGFYLRVTADEQKRIDEEKLAEVSLGQAKDDQVKQKINIKDVNIDIPVIPASVRSLISGIQN